MSYTIVHDGQQASRDLENVVNRILRHCKIGKVTRKTRPAIFQDAVRDYQKAIEWPPMMNDWTRYYRSNRKCSCKPGQACNNAACPHMPIVTCGTAVPAHGALL